MIDGGISVVIPAYNEAQRIAANLRDTIAAFDELGAPFEIILVDDGSPDATWGEAADGKASVIRVIDSLPRRADQTEPRMEDGPVVRIIWYPRHRGKGHALARGSWAARGNYITFLDADLDLHPKQLLKFFAIMAGQGADAVIGSKLHPQSRTNYLRHRRALSMGFYMLVRLMFGLPVRDTQTGMKLFKSQVLRDALAHVTADGFAFDLELLVVAHLLGYRIVEAPVEIEIRRQISRISVNDIAAVARDTLGIFYRQKMRRAYAQTSASRGNERYVELVTRAGDRVAAP